MRRRAAGNAGAADAGGGGERPAGSRRFTRMGTQNMTTGLIICGALGHEVVDLIERHGWDAEIAAVPAHVHLYPERIAPRVVARIEELRAHYARLIVVFGDCGSGGALDRALEAYPDIVRLEGQHCYEWYAGEAFQEFMDEEPGTFFLTDFMVRGWQGTVMKGLGLDRFPELKDEYFKNYRRIVYLVQKPRPELLEQARGVAAYLNLPLEIRATGYHRLEEQLKSLLDGVDHPR